MKNVREKKRRLKTQTKGDLAYAMGVAGKPWEHSLMALRAAQKTLRAAGYRSLVEGLELFVWGRLEEIRRKQLTPD